MRRSAAASVTAVLFGSAMGLAGPDTSLDHFQCYEVKPSGAFRRDGVRLVDRFGSSTVGLREAFALCAPADKNDEDPSAPSDVDHLTSYGVRPGGSFAPVRDQELVNQLGTVRLDVVKPTRLFVPTAKSLAGPPAPLIPAVDHFQCYKERRSRGTPRFAAIRDVKVDTPLEAASSVDLVKPLRLCVPVDKNDERPGVENHPDLLLCYRAKSASGIPTTRVSLDNQFGAQDYLINQRREFCVPSRQVVPTTTSTTTSTSTTTTLGGPSCEGLYPTCGGSCPDGFACQPHSDISQLLQECRCFPSGVTPCDETSYPTCGGTCLDGRTCAPIALRDRELNTLEFCACASGGCGPVFPQMCVAIGACPEGFACIASAVEPLCNCTPLP
jgi:hypothetical protein